ncbi:MFS transporter [Streptomyces antimycoticus]|uniref:MFS transporter n=1 Tax=Streptomyces antimycoticus TaxID=68175 RepID=UPI0032EBDD9A
MTTEEGRAVGPWSRRLAPWQAFCLQASVVVFFLAGASAPTPLYATYQRKWHFSPITTTVIFGVYAVAILLALLIVGSLSDHAGRRSVIFGSIVVQAAAAVVFAGVDGVPMLLCGRILQGLATGTVVGAVGAGMIDVNQLGGNARQRGDTGRGYRRGRLGIRAPGDLRAAAHAPRLLHPSGRLRTTGRRRDLHGRDRCPHPRCAALTACELDRARAGARSACGGRCGAAGRLGAAGFYGSLGPALVHRTCRAAAPREEAVNRVGGGFGFASAVLASAGMITDNTRGLCRSPRLPAHARHRTSAPCEWS